MAQNLRQLARQKAKKYGLDPDIFERQIEAESGFNPRARSHAGAAGVAQIMPGTARSWGVDPYDPPAALDAAAKNMAKYVRQFGSYENALRAYNAGPGAVEKSRQYRETNNYVAKILKGREPGQLGKPARVRAQASSAPQVQLGPAGPPVTPEGLTRTDLLQNYVLNRGKPGTLAGLGAGLGSLQQPERPIISVTGTSQKPAQVGGAKTWGGAIRPSGGYAGTEGIAKGLAGFGFKLGLKATSEKRHNTNPHSGRNSDHDHRNKHAYGIDISNGSRPTREMDETAYRIMHELGFKDYKMGQPINTSQGVRTIRKGGKQYRVQVIYRGDGAAFGGNHLDHIHVGVRRVG